MTLKEVGVLWCFCLKAPKRFSTAFTGLNQLQLHGSTTGYSTAVEKELV